ncbi:hypothetical protein [Companilactobacillus nodensis]|uniref:hypothetical protein n=1 Tax=Companilactobacillus nodensis TaxID=460870 RepID=UPI001F443096
MILKSDKWHQGILGIVASRAVDQENKPALVMQYDEESQLYKGSGRSLKASTYLKH